MAALALDSPRLQLGLPKLGTPEVSPEIRALQLR